MILELTVVVMILGWGQWVGRGVIVVVMVILVIVVVVMMINPVPIWFRAGFSLGEFDNFTTSKHFAICLLSNRRHPCYSIQFNPIQLTEYGLLVGFGQYLRCQNLRAYW